MSIIRHVSIVISIVVLFATGIVGAASATAASPVPAAKNIVLVHGAYADGSSWAKVIPILQKAGLHVTSVQNPLTSFEEDVDATNRILALQDGATVLVAHSYGGMVISQSGVDPKVSSLVYIAARAPDSGEDYTALAGKYPTPPASKGLERFGGFAQLSEEAFVNDFAQDLPKEEAEQLFAVQGRVSDTLFTSKTTQAAWHTKPSYYAVSRNDRTINPDLQRFMAERMKAHTVELDASHVSLISQPEQVADLILEAAGIKAAN